jgi:menaquinone-dependent protoporphyrinogen IX oxidase
VNRIGIFYASRRGQTRRILSALVDGLATHAVAAEALELRSRSEWPRLDGYRAAIVASPVHAGHYAGRVVSFVKAGREALEKVRFCARFAGRLDAEAPGAAISPASGPGA